MTAPSLLVETERSGRKPGELDIALLCRDSEGTSVLRPDAPVALLADNVAVCEISTVSRETRFERSSQEALYTGNNSVGISTMV